MSSRRGSEAARLRRLRRTAGRHGLAILAAGKPSSKVSGGYMISNDEQHHVLVGDKPVPYAMTLDEVEAYLEAETGEAGDDEDVSEDLDI
jgi:hypothetical protein